MGRGANTDHGRYMSGKRGVSGVYGARGGNGAGLMVAGEAHCAPAVTWRAEDVYSGSETLG